MWSIFASFVKMCIAVKDTIIKRGKDVNLIVRFTHVTFLHISQTRIWIFNIINVVVFLCQ